MIYDFESGSKRRDDTRQMNCGFRIMSLRAKRGNLDCGLGIDRRPPASAGRLRQTNPISGGPYTPVFHYSIIPPSQSDAGCTNKAKHGHPGLSGEPDARRRANAPNKPNFGPDETSDKCCTDMELRRIGRAGGLGKTKPIREDLQV